MKHLIALAVSLFLVACNLGDPDTNVNNFNNENNGADTGSDGANNVNNMNNVNNGMPDTGAEDASVDMSVDMAPDALTLEEFCDARGLAWANELFNCYSYGPYASYYYDPTRPNAVRQWQYGCRGYQAHIDAGTMAFDGVQAARCSQAMEAIADQCVRGEEPHRFLPECQGVVTGLAAPGTACFELDECTDGHFCNINNACPGSCTRYAQVGEDCSATPCEWPENRCDFANGQVCVAREPAGGTCNDSFECLDGFCVNGTCRAWSDYSDACDDNAPCRMGELVQPAQDAVVHQCNGDVCSFKAGGGECMYDYNCIVGEWCERPDQTMTGSCEALPQLAQACGNGFQCAAGLFCMNGVCEAAAGENELCNAGVPCADNQRMFCMADGRCHPEGAAGDPCEPGNQQSCQIGLVCNPTTNLCGQRAANGQRCNPRHGQSEPFFDGENTPACVDGFACLCDGVGCSQNNLSVSHTCRPADPNVTPCRKSSDCAADEFCDNFSQSGLPICRQGGCTRR